MIRALLFLAALALAGAAPAAGDDEPEAVYAKYHRASVSGDLNEVARYADSAQRVEISAMSTAQRAAQAKMAAATMPRAYVLKAKRVSPDGRSARLLLSGTSPDASETLYGTARMVREGNDWKVVGVDWTDQDPSPPAQAAPAKPAAKPAAPGAAAARGAPVGSLESAPVRKLGAQKPPCEFKPVMTAEDLENCR